jgi:putative ABC transport system permease protein
VLGVLVTLLLSAIANVIVWHRFEIRNIAQLPWQAALALIGISCLLTFVAGLFPSSHAARQDPVVALRSE